MGPDREELLDMLYDLQHDLGKYLRLPLAMLPARASDEEVRQAVRAALQETRKSPSGIRAAQDIWDDFLMEEKGLLAPFPARARLVNAVDRALGWTSRLDAPAALDRALVRRDFESVSRAAADLIEEVANDA